MKKFSQPLCGVLMVLAPAFLVAASAFAGTHAGTERVIREVRHELLLLPYYGIFDHLEFTVSDGAVELHGAVTRPTLKSEAENVVKTIEGVSEVRNHIEVLPLSGMDDQIRLASYRAIYGDSALSARYGHRAQPPVHIIVRNGDVTLEGAVANEFDRNVVKMRANGVPNVFSVTDNLRVDEPGA